MFWSVSLLILMQIKLRISKRERLVKENKSDRELAMLYGIVNNRIICKIKMHKHLA